MSRCLSCRIILPLDDRRGDACTLLCTLLIGSTRIRMMKMSHLSSQGDYLVLFGSHCLYVLERLKSGGACSNSHALDGRPHNSQLLPLFLGPRQSTHHPLHTNMIALQWRKEGLLLTMLRSVEFLCFGHGIYHSLHWLRCVLLLAFSAQPTEWVEGRAVANTPIID